MSEHSAEKDVTSIVDRLNHIQAEHEAAERADEPPAITFGMDDDRIVFRDQAALDEYVHGALDDCDAQALRRNAKHGQIVHAAQAQAWDEGVRHAESCAGGLTCDPRTANPYRVLPPGQGRTKEPTP